MNPMPSTPPFFEGGTSSRCIWFANKKHAPAGNRTRGGSVGGYHVTTTPLALADNPAKICPLILHLLGYRMPIILLPNL